ncbi:MAG: alpha/beta hydrolase, partial [Granulosicoccaceae bacterium]
MKNKLELLGLVTVLWALSMTQAASAAQDWFQSTQPVLPVISLRQLESAGKNFEPNDYRGELRYVEVSASVVKLNAFGQQLKDLPVYLPDRWTNTEKVEMLGEEQLYRLLFADAGRPVLYIHGYNEGFDKSVKRALQLRQQLELEGRLILLSWPSDGNFINYTRDEADLYWSVPYIRRAIESLAAEYGKGGFDLIAHSLGGRGLSLAIAQLYDTRPDLRPIAGQTILVAPDMDAQVFVDQQHKITGNTTRLSLFSSGLDEPLAISAALHGYPRLGQSG